MKQINPMCIRRPTNPLPKNFVPQGGIRQQVHDHTSWKTFAQQLGMDPWALIRFNYPTLPREIERAAREVNYYLQENVGCKEVTNDLKNYVFSESAKPGYIYLPPKRMIVEVLDMDDSTTGRAADSIGLWNAAHRPGAGRTILKLYGMSNGVGQMVAEIKQVSWPGSIEVLRIWGHGYPGGQGVSGGHSGTSFRDDFAGMTVDNFNSIRGTLGALRPLFAPGARVELRGCDVAQGNGDQLLVKLAQLWGVRVQGGTVTQHASSNWDGQPVEAGPDGALRSVIGTPL